MITLKDFMETVDYRITEGSDYGWQCYGTDAHSLDSWNQQQDGHSVSIVFDTRTQTVYEASAYDYKHNRAYRLINPDYREAHSDEAREKNVLEKQAWDDVNYVDLETDDDFLTKARSIVLGEDYDTRVSVPLNLPDDSLFQLMKLAHEADQTLNQFVEQILKEAIEREQLQQELEDLRPEYDFSDAVEGIPLSSMKKIKKSKKKSKTS
jgi:hypothetical protein